MTITEKKQIIFKEFIKFLKIEDLYLKYLESLTINNPKEDFLFNSNSLTRMMECGGKGRYGYHAIGCAFLWDSTEDGHDFWQNVDEKWKTKWENIITNLN